jgi:hypothetical protein
VSDRRRTGIHAERDTGHVSHGQRDEGLLRSLTQNVRNEREDVAAAVYLMDSL